MITKPTSVLEWIAMFGDVSNQWKAQKKLVARHCRDAIDDFSLNEWLHEIYFSETRKAGFSKSDVHCFDELLAKMLPEDRLSSDGILQHEWFARNSQENK